VIIGKGLLWPSINFRPPRVVSSNIAFPTRNISNKYLTSQTKTALLCLFHTNTKRRTFVYLFRRLLHFRSGSTT